MTKTKAIFAGLLLCSQTAVGCDKASIALQYLAAIDAMQWDVMASHLASDATYADPTMTYFDRAPVRLVGAEAIVEFWRTSSEASGTNDIQYTVIACMETAGYHVVSLDLVSRVAGAFWNVNQDVIELSGRVISILRVEGDRVIEHVDYVEYSAAEETVARLRERFGTLERR
ncbi:MAG: nuclear transport factor 2 family protein [Pseudomonadota bacterium]